MYELENTEKMSLRFLPSFLFRYVTLDFNLPHWGGSVLARYVSVVYFSYLIPLTRPYQSVCYQS